ncbi:MAG: hypothetical protein QNJ64_06555 [Crocosphaera sp.]|nr:hypothetical protein [Crocosphaera sp.]
MTTKLSLSDIEYWQKKWPKDEETEVAFEIILIEDGDIETAFNELFKQKNVTIQYGNQSLWQVTITILRQEICNKNDSLKSEIQTLRKNPKETAIITGIIVSIIERCQLPLDTGLATMIVLWILKIGIDIFCDYTANNQ